MVNNSKLDNEAVKANKKINEILEDGRVHESIRGRSEAETANLELQNHFGNENKEHDISASPASIVTPH
jgi:hypothetical protein